MAALFIDLDGFKDVNDTFGHGVGRPASPGGGRPAAAPCARATPSAVWAATSSSCSSTARPWTPGPSWSPSACSPSSGNRSSSRNCPAGRCRYRQHRDRRRRPGLCRRAPAGRRHRPLRGQGGGQGPLRRLLARDADAPSRTASSSRWTSGTPWPASSSSSLPTHLQSPDGETTGVEALLRWRHPDRGIVHRTLHPHPRRHRDDHRGRPVGARRSLPPGRPLARQGYQLDISVNVSARQLETDQLIEDVRRAWSDRSSTPARSPSRSPRPRSCRTWPPSSPVGRAQSPRRPDRHRRLRHRLLVARLPPAVPRRHPQDRPVVHLGHGRLAGVRGAHPHPGPAGQDARPRDPGRGQCGQGYLYARPLEPDAVEALSPRVGGQR